MHFSLIFLIICHFYERKCNFTQVNWIKNQLKMCFWCSDFLSWLENLFLRGCIFTALHEETIVCSCWRPAWLIMDSNKIKYSMEKGNLYAQRRQRFFRQAPLVELIKNAGSSALHALGLRLACVYSAEKHFRQTSCLPIIKNGACVWRGWSSWRGGGESVERDTARRRKSVWAYLCLRVCWLSEYFSRSWLLIGSRLPLRRFGWGPTARGGKKSTHKHHTNKLHTKLTSLNWKLWIFAWLLLRVAPGHCADALLLVNESCVTVRSFSPSHNTVQSNDKKRAKL